jgi:hypothetical protein
MSDRTGSSCQGGGALRYAAFLAEDETLEFLGSVGTYDINQSIVVVDSSSIRRPRLSI